MTADAVLPIAVAAPLGVAALLMVVARGRVRRAAGSAAAVAAFGVAGSLAWLATTIGDGAVVHWFGGWRPSGGLVPGIPFVAGPMSTPLAALVALLVGIVLVYSHRYFDDLNLPYLVLMLTFLAGMMGFVLTGDAFNLFIFYELVGVSAYALTGYVVRHEGPLQGAINFAVSNTVGSLLLLTGVVFLYVATGTPNMAQAGEAIRSGQTGTPVLAAYALIAAGCFVKAAVVPFHFWHADAHAVAPTPVCAVFAAIMIQLGIYVFARMNWAVFDGLWHGHEQGWRVLLLAVAALTAVIGAVMALLQTNIKRMLAFSSVGHTGIALTGIALLTSTGLAGTGVYVVSHAFVKAALFLAAGIVLYRLGAVDERELHGRGRGLPVTGALFGVGALALAGVPLFGLSIGKELIDRSASHHGLAWLTIPLLVLVGGLTGGAVLRAGARIFLGWGARAAADAASEDEAGEAEGEERETDEDAGGIPAVLLVPVIVLLAAGLLVGVVPAVTDIAESAARWFTDAERYASAVLGTGPSGLQTVTSDWLSAKGIAAGLGSTVLAIMVAGLGLWGHRVLADPLRVAHRIARPPLTALRAGHSGHVGDYVAWLLVGLATFATLTGIALGSLS